MNVPLHLIALCSIGALGFAAAETRAQSQEPIAPPEAAEQQTADVTEEELQTFAEIYVDVETTRTELSEEMTEAETPEAAQDIQTRFEEEMIAAIEKHGWSVDDYNRVAAAISNDPEKREKAVELINRIVS
ncbi:MAG: DUF4168 domain-containing protein [Woeseia sp.]